MMQMPRTILAADMVKEKGLPYIVLLTDPTTGEFRRLSRWSATSPSPSLAPSWDLPARGHRGDDPREIAGGFQRAEYLFDHGMVDLVVPRAECTQR